MIHNIVMSYVGTTFWKVVSAIIMLGKLTERLNFSFTFRNNYDIKANQHHQREREDFDACAKRRLYYSTNWASSVFFLIFTSFRFEDSNFLFYSSFSLTQRAAIWRRNKLNNSTNDSIIIISFVHYADEVRKRTKMKLQNRELTIS